MSVSGPAFRINESNIPNIAKKVKEYCGYISKEMGCNFNLFGGKIKKRRC